MTDRGLSAVKSEEFLPPAHKRHSRLGGDKVLSQQEDREKMVCAVGIDVHYELNMVSNETGAYRPRLQPFNPRMMGPAAPETYTGRVSLSESKREELDNDPILLGREVSKTKPYDELLYKKKDPRLVSKCVVVRDYGCKIPIDLADTTKIAQAVLNHFPDQYVSFLGEFVSNMFGVAMRDYLDVNIKGLQRLLDKTDDLNRISWQIYAAVQGGRTIDDATDANTPGTLQDIDSTLHWQSSLTPALNKISDKGTVMTEHVSSHDLFDLRPCINQHIDTLSMMKNEWCRGFASKEEHVLAMMYWINEKGRHYGDDLMLIDDNKHIDYDRLVAHVPINPFQNKIDGGQTQSFTPTSNPAITKDLRDEPKTLHTAFTNIMPVGKWTGTGQNTFVDPNNIGTYSWGFGHTALMARRMILDSKDAAEQNIRYRAGTDYNAHIRTAYDNNNGVIGPSQQSLFTHLLLAPYLRYKTPTLRPDPKAAMEGKMMNRSTIDLSDPNVAKTGVDEHKWGSANFAQNIVTTRNNLIDKSTPPQTKRVRDTLLDDEELNFKGSAQYRSGAARFTNNNTVPYAPQNGGFHPYHVDRSFTHIPKEAAASNSAFSFCDARVFNPKISRECNSFIPFEYVDCPTVVDDKLKIKKEALAKFDIQKMCNENSDISKIVSVNRPSLSPLLSSLQNTFFIDCEGLTRAATVTDLRRAITYSLLHIRYAPGAPTTLLLPTPDERDQIFERTPEPGAIPAPEQHISEICMKDRKDLIGLTPRGAGGPPPPYRDHISIFDRYVLGVAALPDPTFVDYTNPVALTPYDTKTPYFFTLYAYLGLHSVCMQINQLGAGGTGSEAKGAAPNHWSNQINDNNTEVNNVKFWIKNADCRNGLLVPSPNRVAHGRFQQIYNYWFSFFKEWIIRWKKDDTYINKLKQLADVVEDDAVWLINNAWVVAPGRNKVLNAGRQNNEIDDFAEVIKMGESYAIHTVHRYQSTLYMAMNPIPNNQELPDHTVAGFGATANWQFVRPYDFDTIKENFANHSAKLRDFYARATELTQQMDETEPNFGVPTRLQAQLRNLYWSEGLLPIEDASSSVLFRDTVLPVRYGPFKTVFSLQNCEFLECAKYALIGVSSQPDTTRVASIHAYEDKLQQVGQVNRALFCQEWNDQRGAKYFPPNSFHIVNTVCETASQNRMPLLPTNYAYEQEFPVALVKSADTGLEPPTRNLEIDPASNDLNELKNMALALRHGMVSAFGSVLAYYILKKIDDDYGGIITRPTGILHVEVKDGIVSVATGSTATPQLVLKATITLMCKAMTDDSILQSASVAKRTKVDQDSIKAYLDDLIGRNLGRVPLELCLISRAVPTHLALWAVVGKDAVQLRKELLDEYDETIGALGKETAIPLAFDAKKMKFRSALQLSPGGQYGEEAVYGAAAAGVTIAINRITSMAKREFPNHASMIDAITGALVAAMSVPVAPATTWVNGNNPPEYQLYLNAVFARTEIVRRAILEQYASMSGAFHRQYATDIANGIAPNIAIDNGILAGQVAGEIPDETTDDLLIIMTGLVIFETAWEFIGRFITHAGNNPGVQPNTYEFFRRFVYGGIATKGERPVPPAALWGGWLANALLAAPQFSEAYVLGITYLQVLDMNPNLIPLPGRGYASIIGETLNEYELFRTRNLPAPGGGALIMAGKPLPAFVSPGYEFFSTYFVLIRVQLLRGTGIVQAKTDAMNFLLTLAAHPPENDAFGNPLSGPQAAPALADQGTFEQVADALSDDLVPPFGIKIPTVPAFGQRVSQVRARYLIPRRQNPGPGPNVGAPNRSYVMTFDPPGLALPQVQLVAGLTVADVVRALNRHAINRFPPGNARMNALGPSSIPKISEYCTPFGTATGLEIFPSCAAYGWADWRSVYRGTEYFVDTDTGRKVHKPDEVSVLSECGGEPINAESAAFQREARQGLPYRAARPGYSDAANVVEDRNAPLFHYFTASEANPNIETYHNNEPLMYNVQHDRPQMFAILDAMSLLMKAKSAFNPSAARTENNEKPDKRESAQDMHYWCRVLAESFLYCRSRNVNTRSSTYEYNVKAKPDATFPPSYIGSLTDDTFKKYFPLLPLNDRLRDNLRKVRALDVFWGMTPGFYVTRNKMAQGSWMPLSHYNASQLLSVANLFDHKYKVPRNPWCVHGNAGVSKIFNQSYHSTFFTDSYKAEHFRDWVDQSLKYQTPCSDNCFYPFTQYGGSPVQADFVPHKVEFPNESVEDRHRQIVYNRFGFTSPLRIGNQFEDRGYLQDMYSKKYRPHARITNDQRNYVTKNRDEVWISNFMAYARTHSIIALASANQGTEDGSVPRIVRNLYRLYVDTYRCMGERPDDETVPCIMGFLPSPVHGKEDRPVTLYAGSLICLNTKLEMFCASSSNSGERVCKLYKQVYLNDAALLFNRLLRKKRRDILHDANYLKARLKRGSTFERKDFDRDLIDLQDAYIEFLQQSMIGLLLESGADFKNVPLHLMEPRELEVPLFEEDTDLVGNDYLTPRTAEIIKEMDFSKDNLNRTQLAILSLIPPNARIIGTLKFNANTEIIDLEHAKKQIQKETIESNKKVWQRYSDALISAAFARNLLEFDGPHDPSFDMSAIKDPLKEAERIKKKSVTTHAQASSSISQTLRSNAMRRETGADSVMSMNTADMERALQAVRDRVERDVSRTGMAPVQCLELLRIPGHVKRMLSKEYSM